MTKVADFTTERLNRMERRLGDVAEELASLRAHVAAEAAKSAARDLDISRVLQKLDRIEARLELRS